MSAFLNQQLTNAGWDALSIALGGGRLTFFKMQAGSGTIANDAAIPAMTALAAPVCDIPISSYVIEGDGQITLFGNINSSQLDAGFTFKELGVFATIENPVAGKGGIPSGPNIQAMVQTPGVLANPVVPPPAEGTALMYSYCNSYDASDYIPGSGESTDVVNTVQVTIKIDQAPDVQINILQGQQLSIVNIGAPSVGAGPWSYTQANVAYMKRLVEGPAMVITEDADTITIGQRQLTADLDLYVANGNPDISPHFSTIQKAIDYLGDYLIPTTIKARIHVSAGTYTITAPVYLNHPNGLSITIQGPQNATIRGTGIASITGSIKNWSVTISGMSSTSGFATNGWAIIDYASGTTSGNEALLCGIFKVTAKTASTVTIKVPYNKASFGVTGLTAIDVTPITAIISAPLNMTGFVVGAYGISLFQYIGVVAQATPTIPMTGLTCNGKARFTFIGATGFNSIVNLPSGDLIVVGIGAGSTGDIYAVSCAATDNQNGILSYGGGNLVLLKCAATHNTNFGFWFEQGGGAVFSSGRCWVGGNWSSGIANSVGSQAVVGNHIPPGIVIIENNFLHGIYATGGGKFVIAPGNATAYSQGNISGYDVVVDTFGLMAGSARLGGSRVFNLPVGQMSSTGGLIN